VAAEFGFMAGLAADTAANWWRSTIASLPPRGIVLVARDASGIIGWTRVGDVPDFAFDTVGNPVATVFFYKSLT
jgi:hypothetical protein